MASRRKRTRTLANIVKDIENRAKVTQRRPAPTRIKRNAVTGDKLVPRTVQAKAIEANTITTAEVAFGTVVYSNTQPTTDLKAGTFWVDSTDNTAAVYDVTTSAFVDVAAVDTVARTSANGKNTIYRQTSQPTGGTYVTGDVWFDTDDDNKIYRYDGSSWVGFTLGNNALTSIAANKITAGSLDAGVIVTSNLDAGKITTGTITSIAYNNGSGTFSVTAAGALTATSATITGAITATSGKLGGFNIISNDYLQYGTTFLYGNSGSSIYTIIDNSRTARFNVVEAGSSSSSAFLTNGGISANGTSSLTTALIGTASNTTLSVTSTIGIVGGYGVNTDWSPNSDAGNSLGQNGRRWIRLWATTTVISTSDQRLKTDVTLSPLGLEFIESLRPVSFRWIVGHKELVKDSDGNPVVKNYDDNGKPVYELINKPGVRRHYGFIAQEVKTALDAAGVGDFAGWVQDDLSDPESSQSLSYEQFIAPLTRAVQELSAKVKALEEK